MSFCCFCWFRRYRVGMPPALEALPGRLHARGF